jgi:hypothetical protein
MVPNQDALDLKRLAVATVWHRIAFVFGLSVPFSSVFTYVPYVRSVLRTFRFAVLRTFRITYFRISVFHIFCGVAMLVIVGRCVSSQCD